MRTLILIPARGGSKGVPGKNVKLLGGIPLIKYTLQFAKQIAEVDDIICLSSDDDKAIEIAEELDILVPFKRPESLSTDEAGMYEVIIHALNYYEQEDKYFDNILLLHTKDCDMVVSVKEAKDNPYFSLFEQDVYGYLKKSKDSSFVRRQDCPKIYAYNGAFYLINTNSIKAKKLHSLDKVLKSIMPEERSIDIDTYHDWAVAEYLLSIKNNK